MKCPDCESEEIYREYDKQKTWFQVDGSGKGIGEPVIDERLFWRCAGCDTESEEWEFFAEED